MAVTDGKTCKWLAYDSSPSGAATVELKGVTRHDRGLKGHAYHVQAGAAAAIQAEEDVVAEVDALARVPLCFAREQLRQYLRA